MKERENFLKISDLESLAKDLRDMTANNKRKTKRDTSNKLKNIYFDLD